MPLRNSVSCPICYKKFFKASFPFHMKVCAKHNSGSFETLTCPLCNTGVQGNFIAEHVKNCQQKRQFRDAISKGVENQRESLGLPFESLQNSMEVATEYNDRLILQPCKYCKRKFNTHRIVAHEKICKKLFVTPKRDVFKSSIKRQTSIRSLGVDWSCGAPLQKEQSSIRNTVVNRNRTFSSKYHKNIRKYDDRNKTFALDGDYNALNSSISSNNKTHAILKVNVASQSNPLAPNHSRYDNVGHYH